MSTVVITGAGPTGLILAWELRRTGTDVEVVDVKVQRSGTSRAMHVRTMEGLDQRGMLSAFLAVGTPIQARHFARRRDARLG